MLRNRADDQGIFEPPWSNFWDDTEEESGNYKTMRINVDHPVRLTRLAFKALLGANKKGVVVLIASGAGLYGVYLAALYCSSKHAVVGLAKSLGPADEEEVRYTHAHIQILSTSLLIFWLPRESRSSASAPAWSRLLCGRFERTTRHACSSTTSRIAPRILQMR